ncbi:YdbH domain-containing protein [Amphritea balenae]|uniref:Uncharacterized protein n=1 Tax=Amphritea balenae TaxID=452629 RepID=A0A3P1SWU7_9GAMM|nr:YdbH domain-containing protein [Amphritea balenae]RRD01712.1 hypothetical protein EHS89_03945 [Amphritea balenae]GGK54772.1 hypothetical protein GCM10007941_00990 [Amphritea balenae]
MRRSMFALALLVFLFGGFYVAIPALAEYSVRQSLNSYGINTRTFVLQHPHWNRIEVSELSFQQQDDQQQLDLTAHSVSLTFSPWLLITEQRIKNLDIARLSVQLILNSRLAEDDQASTVLPALPLPSQILAQLPAEQVSLSHYDMSISIGAQRLGFSGKAEINSNQAGISINRIDSAPELSARLTATRQDKVKLNLSLNNSALLTSELSPLITNNQLKLTSTSQLNTDKLAQLLQLPLIQQLTDNSIDKNGLAIGLKTLTGNIELQGQSIFPMSLSGLLINSTSAEHQYQLGSQLKLQQPVSGLKLLSIDLAAAITVKDQQFEAELQQFSGVGINLNIEPEPTLSTTKTELGLTQPVIARGTLAQLQQNYLQELEIEPVLLKISGEPLQIKISRQPDYKLKYEPLNIRLTELSAASLSAKAEISSANIKLSQGNTTFPDVAFKTTAQLSEKRMVHRFKFSLNDRHLPPGGINISGSSKTDFESAHSTAKWKASPLSLTGIEKLLQRYIPELPPELIINEGSLTHQGWLDMNKTGIALRFLNRARKTSLSYDQTHLYDINWDSETVKSHRGKLQDMGKLTIAFIDAGAPLENFSGGYQFIQHRSGKQQLSLDSSTVELLGGQVTSLPVSFDPIQPEINTAIAVTHIDLAQLIALEQQQGLTGSGTLNGQLPIRYNGGELSISDGQINSTPAGGWIRFDPPPSFIALQKTNPALGIAFDALRNLQYQSLGIKLDYLPDGTALLKTHLKGHNPDWNNAQPVDFTVNIEENIPKLIQALQFTDKLTETLEKRYR